MKFIPKLSVPSRGNQRNRLGISAANPQKSGNGGMTTTSPLSDCKLLQVKGADSSPVAWFMSNTFSVTACHSFFSSGILDCFSDFLNVKCSLVK